MRRAQSIISAAIAAVATHSLAGGVVASEQRIVSVGGAITEIVWALGLGPQVVAVDTSSIYPAQVAQLPKVGYQRTLSPEGIIAMQPTIVVASAEAGPASALEALRNVGIRVVIAPEARTVETAIKRIERIGEELGAVERAGQLATAMRTEVGAVSKPTTDAAPPRIVFVLSRGKGSPIVAGNDTAAAAIITIAGGVNAITEFNGYKPLSPEAAATLGPDVLLTTTRIIDEAGGRDAFLSQPNIAPLMQKARLVVMDDLLLLGFGPRLGQALAELRQAFGGA